MLTGGCYCGNVRYEVTGVPFDSNVCHCIDCRRISGAPMFAWFSVQTPDLRYVRGEPRRFASSERAHREFCPDCGTPLTYQNDETPDEIDVATCTLDDPGAVPPDVHIWTRRQVPWIKLADQLPTHE